MVNVSAPRWGDDPEMQKPRITGLSAMKWRRCRDSNSRIGLPIDGFQVYR
ncbi:hypothetical protein [Pseudomonas phage Fyn8]|nr:hypothetical protein [Pseudomonas phage Fyn8]